MEFLGTYFQAKFILRVEGEDYDKHKFVQSISHIRKRGDVQIIFIQCQILSPFTCIIQKVNGSVLHHMATNII